MKMSLLKLAVVLLGVTSLVACAESPFKFFQSSVSAQDDCGFVQNVYGERISWKGRLPIQLKVHSSFPQEFYGALESAIKKWEQAAGKPLFQLAGFIDGPILPRQDNSNILYYMHNWEENKSTEQARTSIYWVGDTIREADIRINAKNFSFYLQVADTASSVHIESLLIHELGHVLGLKHKDRDSSVMGTYLSSQTQRSSISGSDSLAMKCEY